VEIKLVTFILKHFSGFQNPFLRILGMWQMLLDLQPQA
jgi:hypothetical protein